MIKLLSNCVVYFIVIGLKRLKNAIQVKTLFKRKVL